MGQSVLVIDDSPDVHSLLDVRLRPEELVVHHALDAEEGLVRAKDLRPDLILLDIDMPRMSGFEICKRLKDEPLTSHIPVIFLTGAAEVASKVQGFDLGAVDYVTKPFEPAELRARVRAALRTKRYLDLLAARSHVDGLTGVWNRAYFNQRLGEECFAADRYGRAISLVMIDLDHFKNLNDSYGHPFGDKVLQAVGELLNGTLRATDAPCRFGGEEFAMILTETNLTGAGFSAERVRSGIAALVFQVANKPVPVTASLGVACSTAFTKGSLSVLGLVTAADDALYAAKHQGRNRVCSSAEGSPLEGAAGVVT